MYDLFTLRQFKPRQPNYSDSQQVPMRPSYMAHPQQEQFFRPRGKSFINRIDHVCNFSLFLLIVTIEFKNYIKTKY